MAQTCRASTLVLYTEINLNSVIGCSVLFLTRFNQNTYTHIQIPAISRRLSELGNVIPHSSDYSDVQLVIHSFEPARYRLTSSIFDFNGFCYSER